MSNSESSSSSSSVMLPLGAIVLGLLAGVCYFVFIGRLAGPQPKPPPAVADNSDTKGTPQQENDPAAKLSLEERRELLKLSQLAIGKVENDEWKEALRLFSQIQAKLPEDSFATRNTAIVVSRQAKLPTQIEPNDIQQADAETAALNVIKVAPKDPVSYILAGRIAGKLGDNTLAYERYQKAVELDPQSVIGWYSIYDTLRTETVGSPDKQERNRLKQAALMRVLEIRPDNLRVPTDLIDVMLETRDIQIVDIFKKFESRMPLLLRMYEQSKGDGKLGEMYAPTLQTLSESKRKGTMDWKAVSLPISMVKNLIRSLDPVVYAVDRLHPDSLDFIQIRFHSSAFSSPDLDVAELHPGIPVSFAAAQEQLPISEPPLDVKIEDYNLDERMDVWVLTSGKLQIFGTSKDSAKWNLLSELTVPEGLNKLLVADMDWDDVPTIGGEGDATAKPMPEGNSKVEVGGCQATDSDVICYGPAGIRIFKNELAPDKSGRTWVAVEKSGMEELKDISTITAADFDHEGDLDLAIGTPDGLQLWSNREQFTFKNVNDQSLMPPKFHVRKVIAVDLDRDVDLDLLVFGDGEGSVTSGIMSNHLHGVLEWRTFEQQELTDVPQGLKHAIVMDADRNVSWDILGTAGAETIVALTRTTGPGMTKSIQKTAVPNVLTGGLVTFDLDNDGYQDLVSWDGKKLQLLRGSHDTKFVPAKEINNPDLPGDVYDCLPADIDQDGDLDLVVSTASGVQVLTNDGGNKNHWLDVRVRAQPRKNPQPAELRLRRINHQGIDSLVEVSSEGYYLPQLVSSSTTHFGLGQRDIAEQLRIIWTNGVPQDVVEAKQGLNICEIQSPKGSCPFAYTWDGERFSFYTDLLWNAPLGLQFAEGVIAPARQWEYLKVPGQRMTPKGDKYVLQITEELWEATYFDQIELIAVDHPADVEIYSNEKVGPASISEYKIHTVRDPRPVVAAHDQRGRNVLTEVSVEDGQFTKSYDAVRRQGLTTEHWLELDLGPITEQGPLTLFLTGWMYPTETSISVGVSQNASNKQARPPALWVPDANGEWKEIRPFMGFPGGKTKTIAVDLTGVFAGSDHWLRIVTNMQFHWDQAFYSVGEQPAEVRSQTLQMESADLHYRGLSQHYWQAGNGPDQYDYSTVLSGPEWPPMQGKFTQFGDVRELLTKSDDLLAVIGAGDEITVTFSLPEKPLPAGWKRDFILHNVGWDKDADLHTLYGQTVEPMPFNAMTSYPDSGNAGPFETPEYQAYLEKYQTRQQNFDEFWRKVKRGRVLKPTQDTIPTPAAPMEKQNAG